MRLAQDVYGDILVADTEIGDGVQKAEESDKTHSSGVPLFFWSGRSGLATSATTTCSFVAVAQEPQRDQHQGMITDGGTGICRDLKDFSKKTGRFGGLLVRNGLRVSRYYVDNETKQVLSTN